MPDDCSAPSPTSLKCSQYDIDWVHVDDPALDYLVQDLLFKREKELHYQKAEIQCYILNKKYKGYKLTATAPSDKACAFIIYGNVNNQAVIINLSMLHEPRSTKEFPKFVRQIIQLND